MLSCILLPAENISCAMKFSKVDLMIKEHVGSVFAKLDSTLSKYLDKFFHVLCLYMRTPLPRASSVLFSGKVSDQRLDVKDFSPSSQITLIPLWCFGINLLIRMYFFSVVFKAIKLTKEERTKSSFLILQLPWVTNTEFLLTISIQFQADKWWEWEYQLGDY